MKKYRKKPVVVEAELFDGSNYDEVSRFLGDTPHYLVKTGGTGIVIPTLEGDMRADPGDFVIRGVKGEFYPCKPDIFVATYEEVG